jgi:hypothetical protein
MNEFKPQEIKVRAWDESTNDMVYPSNNLAFTSADILKRYSIVMLYTNVQDTNKTDIYDGDIITNYRGDIYAVQQGVGRWRAVLKKRATSFLPAQYLDCVYMEWEVIGNIYENEVDELVCRQLY